MKIAEKTTIEELLLHRLNLAPPWRISWWHTALQNLAVAPLRLRFCALYAANLSTNSAQYLVGGAIKTMSEKMSEPLVKGVVFDSMINIRPSQGNRSRGVEDPAIRQLICEIVAEKVDDKTDGLLSI